LFEEAKEIAGEALSSVIVRALREYVTRHQEKEKGMRDVAIKVGSAGAEREQRFVGAQLGNWTGLSEDKEWYLDAKIYRTQKGNWAIYLVHVCKASMLTNQQEWKQSGDYLVNSKRAELIVAQQPEDLEDKIPKALVTMVHELALREDNAVEVLDI
jgi:EXLDI family protein